MVQTVKTYSRMDKIGEGEGSPEVEVTPVLRCALLGEPQISRSDGTNLAARWRKELALLTYLAVESQQPHSRETLASLLWPDAPDTAARNALRVAITVLRDLLGDSPTPYLRATRTTLQFAPDSPYWLDVAIFDQHIAASRRHRHPPGELCDTCSAALTDAVALYRGDFLAGVTLPASVAFEEWALLQRETFHQQMLEACALLAAFHEQRGAYDLLCTYARRQLDLESWRESAWRQLMRGSALSGDRTAALKQYAECCRVLADELGLEPEVETRSLYERIRAGEEGGPPERVASPPHNLPISLTPFVGRETELARIDALWQHDRVRLLTLVGAGGMGKTRLALEVARTQLGAFADGVFFVALAPLTDAAAIIPTLATTLNIGLNGSDPHHGIDGRQTVLEALRPKRLLLILDNFEHLLNGADIVSDILQYAPDIAIVVTSRERLNLQGEHQYSVEGLAYTLEEAEADTTQTPAVRLFVQSARKVLPGFKLKPGDATALRHICEVVDGMPLGLELAAAWVEALPLEAIAVEIDRSLDFLSVEWRDMPARQRSMRAVFDWSWRLLTETERQVLGQLAVFRGGFSRDAAQMVANTPLSVLTALTRKALVHLRRTPDITWRYEIHELVRQFALEQLHSAPAERAAASARHARFYLALAESAAPKYQSAEQSEWLSEIELDHDNIRAALGWAAAQGEFALGLQLAAALWPFWQRHCHFHEGRHWLEVFLTNSMVQTVAPEVRATALIGAGWLAHDQDDFEHAEAFFNAGLELDRRLGHSARMSAVLAHRGVMARGQGQYAQAKRLIEESIVLARGMEDRGALAYALFRLGLVTREQGNYARATTAYTECLSSYRALGDRNGVAFALLGLGDIARDQGEAQACTTFSTQSLAISRELGQHWGVGFSLNNLALRALMDGEGLRAEALAAEALALFRTHGIRGGVLELLITQAQIARVLGEDERARSLLQDGIAQGWPAGPHWLVVTGLEELVGVIVADGDVRRAVELAGAAAAWRSAMGAPIQPYRHAAYEVLLDTARQMLGDNTFAAAWAEGTLWLPSQAVDRVVSNLDLHSVFRTFGLSTNPTITKPGT